MYIQSKHLYTSRHVVFHENRFLFEENVSSIGSFDVSALVESYFQLTPLVLSSSSHPLMPQESLLPFHINQTTYIPFSSSS